MGDAIIEVLEIFFYTAVLEHQDPRGIASWLMFRPWMQHTYYHFTGFLRLFIPFLYGGIRRKG
jgi:hypothetical protein